MKHFTALSLAVGLAALVASCDSALLGPEGAVVINGVVVDSETFAGIPGAAVSIAGGIDTLVATDSAGRFVVSDVPPGSYRVQASAPGYRIGNLVISTDIDLFGPDTLALAPELPRASLRGYWPFDGTANDASGNGHHGTLTGTLWTSDRFDATQSAIQIDGAAGVVNVIDGAGSTFSATQDFSVTAWIKFTANQPGDPAIISRFSSGVGFELRIEDATVVAEIRSAHGSVAARSLRHLNDGRWHMLAFAVSRAQRSVELYVDGDFLDMPSGAAAQAAIDNSGPLLIGRSAASGVSFGGAIDDVRLFGRRITADDVRGLCHEKGW